MPAWPSQWAVPVSRSLARTFHLVKVPWIPIFSVLWSVLKPLQMLSLVILILISLVFLHVVLQCVSVRLYQSRLEYRPWFCSLPNRPERHYACWKELARLVLASFLKLFHFTSSIFCISSSNLNLCHLSKFNSQ